MRDKHSPIETIPEKCVHDLIDSAVKKGIRLRIILDEHWARVTWWDGDELRGTDCIYYQDYASPSEATLVALSKALHEALGKKK